MTQNKAAQDLANLTQAAEANKDQAARDAQLAQQIGTSGAKWAGKSGESGEEETAAFAAPEALATAVVTGFVLGPVGGLLLGAAQGWLGKQERQNILDQQADRNEALGGAQDVLRGQFDTLEANATGQEDLDQLSTLRTQQEAAFKLMFSGDPALAQQGSALMQSVQGEVNGFAQTQEQQRIDREVRDGELQRTLDNEGYQRFTTLEDDFSAESQGYEDIMGATNLALEALERGNPADLWAATVLVNKALDPTSVVRQEEASAIGALGSLWEKAGTIVERAYNGQSILPEQRRELSALVSTVRNGSQQLQVSREARYKEQLADSNVPFKYWDNFTRTDNVPAYEQGELQNAASQVKDGETKGLLDDLVEASQMSVTDGFEAIDSGFTKGVNAINELSKQGERAWLDIFVPDSVTSGRPKPSRGHN